MSVTAPRRYHRSISTVRTVVAGAAQRVGVAALAGERREGVGFRCIPRLFTQPHELRGSRKVAPVCGLPMERFGAGGVSGT